MSESGNEPATLGMVHGLVPRVQSKLLSHVGLIDFRRVEAGADCGNWTEAEEISSAKADTGTGNVV